MWSALFVVAIALWVRVAFLSGTDTTDRALVRLAGAPIVLVALGLLWWAWWSVRALRRGRREGWTLLLVLGGVSVVQAVLTSRAVLAAPVPAGGTAPPGRPARSSAVSWRSSHWGWSASSSPCWPAAAGRRPTSPPARTRGHGRRLDAGRRGQRPGLTICSRSRTEAASGARGLRLTTNAALSTMANPTSCHGPSDSPSTNTPSSTDTTGIR